MTCGFCANEARERAFTGFAGDGGRRFCICYDCVREPYVAMFAPEMRAPRPSRKPVRPPSRRALVKRLYPRPEA